MARNIWREACFRDILRRAARCCPVATGLSIPTQVAGKHTSPISIVRKGPNVRTIQSGRLGKVLQKKYRNTLIGILILFGLAIAIPTFDRSREFRIDGWCLRHSGEDLEFWPHPNRPRGIPDFRVPSHFPLPAINRDPGETGLIVSYTKRPTYSRRSEHVGGGPGRAGCERLPPVDGLSRLTGEGLPNCSVRESREWHSDRFEPAEPFDVLEGVFVRCSRSESARSCHLTGLLANGWEATVVLPMSHRHEWQYTARAARDYFETYLSDCGE